MIDNNKAKKEAELIPKQLDNSYDGLRSRLLNMAVKQRVLSDQVKVIERVSTRHGVAILPLTVFTFRQQFFEHKLKYFLRELDLFIWMIDINSQPSPKPKALLKIEGKTLGQTIFLLNQYISTSIVTASLPNIKKLLIISQRVNDKRKIVIHHLFDGDSNLQQVEDDAKEGIVLINKAEIFIDGIKDKLHV